MTLARHLASALVAIAAVCLTGCSAPETTGPPPDSRSWWNGNGVAGRPRIVIDLSQQRLNYYKGNQLVGVSPISSGREGHGTCNGSFHIMDKDLHHRSSLYGSYVNSAGNTVVGDVDASRDPQPAGTRFLGARMTYFMRIVGGIGMHEGYLPGYPASHGCIRLPTRMAAIFFQETPVGTPVQIVGSGMHASAEEPIPVGEGDVLQAPTAVASTASRRSRTETVPRPTSAVAATSSSTAKTRPTAATPTTKKDTHAVMAAKPASPAPSKSRTVASDKPAKKKKSFGFFSRHKRGETLYLEE